MMTMREAKQRAEINGARIDRVPGTIELRVTLNEWRGAEAEDKAYYTDCIEDAVITASKMRIRA